ncbi:origin of replication complex subunit 6-like [Olea europaea var. sylvestris]|uniref:origin of replication complex subunit 6-like n=1 Tax=Olea europaea var. sylvestris TaxID=158386 RepID=UPI000C1D0FEE|nr:origin of replication complex subunit 6-like [Olea europaea var. sylvestris]
MDMSEIAKKLGLSESKQLVRKASEIRRLADIQFDSSAIGVGEICKAIICLEIASSRMEVIFDRQAAIKLSGLSEKAYSRSFNSMQNGIGVKNKLDVRELAIRFGCIRLIPLVLKGLSLYKERFLTSLPSSRRASTDFTRPVFTAVAFYLCAKRHKLKADKIKLIELAGSSESEFSTVSTSMKDICFDAFGTTKEKKDPKDVKGNRELLNALPEKRRLEDGGYSSDDGEEPSAYKKRKQMDNRDYNEWKSAVLQSNNTAKAKAPAKRSRQSGLNFEKKAPKTSMEAT